MAQKSAKTVTLSVSMALSALGESVDDVIAAEKHLKDTREVRNDLIRDAVTAGISYNRVSRITGLSRDRIYTIVNTPGSHRSPYAAPDPAVDQVLAARAQANAHGKRGPVPEGY